MKERTKHIAATAVLILFPVEIVAIVILADFLSHAYHINGFVLGIGAFLLSMMPLMWAGSIITPTEHIKPNPDL